MTYLKNTRQAKLNTIRFAIFKATQLKYSNTPQRIRNHREIICDGLLHDEYLYASNNSINNRITVAARKTFYAMCIDVFGKAQGEIIARENLNIDRQLMHKEIRIASDFQQEVLDRALKFYRYYSNDGEHFLEWMNIRAKLPKEQLQAA